MENVVIPNSLQFNHIKTNIINDGFDELHILSDFDRTLTHAFVDKTESVPSLISILRDENFLSKDYRKKAKDLFSYYYPIEIDSDIAFFKKKRLMEIWWEKHANLLVESGLNKKDLIKIAQSNRIKFRDKLQEILYILNTNNVPFLILSASGLGKDSIIEKRGPQLAQFINGYR